ncbi:unnamed protein product [Amoebophrya sp. A25]|nr:unnamed protein product [Amoebophrya sp. A25]|eukprot:GSA25T00002773001.1
MKDEVGNKLYMMSKIFIFGTVKAMRRLMLYITK